MKPYFTLDPTRRLLTWRAIIKPKPAPTWWTRLCSFLDKVFWP